MTMLHRRRMMNRQEGEIDGAEEGGGLGLGGHRMVITGAPLRDMRDNNNNINNNNDKSGGNGSPDGNDRRRGSSGNWDTISLGGESFGANSLDRSPAPHKAIMSKEDFFSKFPGMSPAISKEVMERGGMNMMFDGRGGAGGGASGNAKMDRIVGGMGGVDNNMSRSEMRERMGMLNNNAEMRQRLMMNS